MKKNLINDQRGIVFLILFFLIVMVGIGFIGWRVYRARSSNSPVTSKIIDTVEQR
jgi:hypothetical protein